LAVVAAAEPSQGRGVSLKLEKMAAAKLTRVGEDGGGGREGGGEKKTAAAGARDRRSCGEPKCHGGAVVGDGGEEE
jgi:hypothetical protein